METKTLDIALVALVIAVLLISGFNMLQMTNMKNEDYGAQQSGMDGMTATQTGFLGVIDVTPKGIPEIYGKELGVSYDDVSSSNQQKADATIKKLGVLDNQIKVSGEDKDRYIAIVSQISCEYCCGVESIIFKDGSAACGCAHSYAIRGLVKYLIKNHPAEFTDDQILEELGKWKTLFFPGQMGKKAAILQEKGIELNYINLASNKYRGIEN